MRNLFLLSAILFLFCFSRCKKDNEEPQLPPETTTGAMTFGCKINGKVFVPKDGNGHAGLFCQYIYINGGWNLNIPAFDWKSSSVPLVSITTDSLLVTEGETYPFKNSKGFAKAFYSDNSGMYKKLDSDTGNLFISKFDPINRILSGTFFFIGTNTSTGQQASVTEGRFDIRY